MTETPRGIDEIIERAMRDGAFDNLQGKGKPLKLDDNPFLDRDWQMAYHLLQENGFSPAFIEKRQTIELELAEARQTLVRTWQWCQGDAQSPDAEMGRAKSKFEAQLLEINKTIRNYNLEIPIPALFKAPISISDEFAQLLV
ncbi:MAG: DUF1992 domain-containing protein [Anaerolineales bacterium]